MHLQLGWRIFRKTFTPEIKHLRVCDCDAFLFLRVLESHIRNFIPLFSFLSFGSIYICPSKNAKRAIFDWTNATASRGRGGRGRGGGGYEERRKGKEGKGREEWLTCSTHFFLYLSRIHINLPSLPSPLYFGSYR